jgi:hypothetical protein
MELAFYSSFKRAMQEPFGSIEQYFFAFHVKIKRRKKNRF